MQYRNDIVPFNDFWLNCDFNAYFSILTSHNEDFRMMAYNNSYRYKIALNTVVEDFYEMSVQTNIDTNDDYYVHKMVMNDFEKKENLADIIREQILIDKIFLLGVDLCYLIPNSVCWKKFHWYHYTLVKGFDDEKKVFYVLDDNLFGYQEFEIPEERLVFAARENTMNPEAYIVEVKKENVAPKVTISSVINNAKEIIKNIETLERPDLYVMSDAYYHEHFGKELNAMYLYQIQNRQRANILLFQNLQKQFNLQEQEVNDSIKPKFEELIKGWRLVQNNFVKIYHSKDRPKQVRKTNDMCFGLLDQEKELWKYIIEFLTEYK